MFAIKVNKKHWMINYFQPDSKDVLTLNTEKQANKEIEFIKRVTHFTDLEVVAVEELYSIDLETGGSIQTITEI